MPEHVTPSPRTPRPTSGTCAAPTDTHPCSVLSLHYAFLIMLASSYCFIMLLLHSIIMPIADYAYYYAAYYYADSTCNLMHVNTQGRHYTPTLLALANPALTTRLRRMATLTTPTNTTHRTYCMVTATTPTPLSIGHRAHSDSLTTHTSTLALYLLSA